MKFHAYDIEGDDKPLDLGTAKLRFGANRFDICIAQKAMYSKSQINTLLGIKPSLTFAVYMNGTHCGKAPGTDSDIPDSYYLYDAVGGPVTSDAFSGNYLMDPTSGWKGYQEDNAVALTTNTGWNALYVDELGLGPIITVSDTPINKADDQPWKWDDWITQMVALIEGYKTAVGVPVWINGLGNGARYFAAPTGIAPTGGNTQLMVSHVEGKALAESFLRGATQPPNYYPTTTAWTREVSMIENGGASLMASTKIWSTYDAPTIARVHRWALGTFLLGANTNASWYFTSKRATGVTPWNPLWDTAKALGAPSGARSGLTRTFANGSVTVNNTTHDATFTIT